MIGVYHSKDLDGYCSGAIMKLKYPDIKLIGMDYGEKYPENLNHEPIIICDMSFPMKDMEEIAKQSNWQLTWIDHHKSAIEDYRKFVGEGETFCNAILQDGIAACEGAWNYFFPDKKMPPVVEFLGTYDTWRKNNKTNDWEFVIMPFQYGMRMKCSSADDFPMELFNEYSYSVGGNNYNSFDKIGNIIKEGDLILKYQSQQNERACKFSAFEIEFEGLRAICLNSGGANSQLFESVYDGTKHDIMIPFVFTGKGWTFSVYSTKENVDCSVIAKKYGGGGHKGAAGFKISDAHWFAETFLFFNQSKKESE
jgi:oligoribonuclease NrnB/cAMP/cGMP phosphodiesterase (DHH superfamily)